jgi:ribosomal protein S12 methylthiotransferase accessory factor
MDMKVTFEGGKRIATRVGNHLIMTDQPAKYGGEDSAPAPYDLFMASIGTCAGFFIKSYCDNKGIDTSGIEITMRPTVDEKTKQVDGFVTTIGVPASVPEPVRKALQRAAEQCAVKKTIRLQPTFVVETVERAP